MNKKELKKWLEELTNPELEKIFKGIVGERSKRRPQKDKNKFAEAGRKAQGYDDPEKLRKKMEKVRANRWKNKDKK